MAAEEGDDASGGKGDPNAAASQGRRFAHQGENAGTHHRPDPQGDEGGNRCMGIRRAAFRQVSTSGPWLWRE
jgi:hypothetical protein